MNNANIVAIEGNLVAIETGATTYNYNGRVVTTKPKNSVTIKMDEGAPIPADIMDAMALVDDNYRPAWVKKPNGFVTISNKFDVPVHRVTGYHDPLGDGHEVPTYEQIGKLSPKTSDDVNNALENAGRVRVYYTVKDKYVNLYAIAILDEKKASTLPF